MVGKSQRDGLKEEPFMSRMFMLGAVCAAGFAVSSCATSQEEVAASIAYTVIAADASIPFASSAVRTYRVGKDADHSLLLEGANSRWYRATLEQTCRHDLQWQQAIAFKADATDRLDKFSSVLIDGRRCQVMALDQIADPDITTPPVTPPAS